MEDILPEMGKPSNRGERRKKKTFLTKELHSHMKKKPFKMPDQDMDMVAFNAWFVRYNNLKRMIDEL
jgi:hypothetical protein